MNLLDILKKDKRDRKVTISAVVHRADGRVEDLGVISEGTVQVVPGSEPKKES
jgi:hypothetical protein